MILVFWCCEVELDGVDEFDFVFEDLVDELVSLEWGFGFEGVGFGVDGEVGFGGEGCALCADMPDMECRFVFDVQFGWLELGFEFLSNPRGEFAFGFERGRVFGQTPDLWRGVGGGGFSSANRRARGARLRGQSNCSPS